MIKPKKASSKDMYALLCDDSQYNPKYDPMICGIYASRKEAQEVANEIKECVLKHVIKKVSVSIKWA
jgi:hypothetical protein